MEHLNSIPFKGERPILGEEEAVHITYYKQSGASYCSALFFIFTSYSSMKGSFVVYWLIDFNKKHSIVPNVGFAQMNFVLPLLIFKLDSKKGTEQ